ncbi:tetratricopeptide repeat protein [Hallella colorans]|nr:tetratricopeptide repeat protein [Hallella colorans]
MTANDYYLKGNEYRKQGDFASAMNNYMEAIRLDANSPAVEAKRMLDDIMNFYCKDFYNP